MEITLESLIIEGRPYQNYLNGIKDHETKKRYNGNLDTFLSELPNSFYQQVFGKAPDPTPDSKAEFFVRFCKKYPDKVFPILSQFLNIQIDRVECGEISPNTVPNYMKPLKVLFNQNDIPFNWKKVNKMYPREQISKDRAYELDEVQRMLAIAPTIIDKVILTIFASSGVRLEAWDYFKWEDVEIFRENGKIIGGQLGFIMVILKNIGHISPLKLANILKCYAKVGSTKLAEHQLQKIICFIL